LIDRRPSPRTQVIRSPRFIPGGPTRPGGSVAIMRPDPTIDCIDCGGRCHLVTHPPEDGRWYPGDLVTYRCEDCNDRWDLLLPDEEEARGDDWQPDQP
jgi:hypothetical protein